MRYFSLRILICCLLKRDENLSNACTDACGTIPISPYAARHHFTDLADATKPSAGTRPTLTFGEKRRP